MLKPRVLSALCAAAGLTLSSGGAQAEVASVVDTDFARMCRGEATAEQVQRLRHHFHTRKTRSVLDRALWRALSQHCGLDVVDMLLGAGASPDAKGERGVTPLIYAVKAGNAEVIRRLLASGADASLKDWGGHDALWHARQRADDDDIVRLLQGGAETKP